MKRRIVWTSAKTTLTKIVRTTAIPTQLLAAGAPQDERESERDRGHCIAEVWIRSASNATLSTRCSVEAVIPGETVAELSREPEVMVAPHLS
jgi:hypothetical protein